MNFKNLHSYWILLFCVLFFSCNSNKDETYNNIIKNRSVKISNSSTSKEKTNHLYYTLLEQTLQKKLHTDFHSNLEKFTNDAFKRKDSTDIYKSQVLRYKSKTYNISQDYYNDLLAASKYFKSKNHPYESYLAHSCLSTIYIKKGNYNEALYESMQALRIIENFKKKYTYEEISTLLDISAIYIAQNRPEDALSILNKIQFLFLNINSYIYSDSSIDYLRSVFFNNLAKTNISFKKNTEAFRNLKFALIHSDNVEDNDFLKGGIIADLVKLKIETNKLDSIEFYISEMVNLRTPYYHLEETQYNFLSIPKYELIKKDTTSAYNYYKKMLYDNQFYENKKLKTKIYEDLITYTDTISKSLIDNYFMALDESVEIKTFENYTIEKINFENQNATKQNDKLKSVNNNIIYSTLFLSIIILFFILKFIKNNKFRVLKYENKYNETDESNFETILGYKKKIDEQSKQNRASVSMELHDGILNKLFTSRFGIIQNISINDNKNKALEILDDSLNQLKIISENSTQFNQQFLENNFHTIVRELIENQPNTNINFQYDLDEHIEIISFNENLKLNLYRIIQEIIQNIHKHSQAKNALIKICINEKIITLIIKDDGIGMNVSKAKKGIGMSNIYKRIEEINGDLEIIVNNGTAFIINVKL